MSQYTDLKNTIDANVNTNGVQSITGAVMNDVLNEIVDFAEGKQDALVSGTNIKTINGESILGSGDIEVQGGGIAEEMEVYIGEEEPTEDGAKLWVDTDEEDEPSSPSAGGGVKTYKFPILMYSFLRTGGFYRFNSEETAAFKNAWANRDNTRFILDVSDGDLYTEAIVEFPFFGRVGGNYYLHTPTQAFIDNYNYQGIMIEELSETELKAVFD